MQRRLKKKLTSREDEKRIVEGFLTMVSDPVQGLDCSSGQLHDVFQQMLNELNADAKVKETFLRMNGYMMEVAELYYKL